MHAYQIVAYILNDSEQKQSDMKKIVIVDGGPRRDMNTAQLLQRVAEGAKSAGAMSIGRRTCNEHTTQVARWRSSKRLQL